MNIRLLFLIFVALTLTACSGKKIMATRGDLQPPPDKGVTVGTVNPLVFKALDIRGDRTLLGGFGKDGNIHFYGRTDTKFNFTDKKTNAKPIKEVTVRIYKESPECFEIDLGSGYVFWYPWNCPH